MCVRTYVRVIKLVPELYRTNKMDELASVVMQETRFIKL